MEVILDARGSMYRKLDGRFRYVIAREVLDDLLANTLPDGIGFALRVFGNREPSSCRSDLEVPLGVLERDAARAVVAGIEPQPYASTPIADSLSGGAADLGAASGRRTVVLVTDGEESCDGGVEAAIDTLRASGVETQLNVIGFDFDADDREAAREQFRRWAERGGGLYYDAGSARELAESLAEATTAPVPFDVVSAAGTVVATGVVNGEPVEVATGVYSVTVGGEAPVRREQIRVRSKTTTTVDVTGE